MLPIYENTKRALGFDPDAPRQCDLDFPQKELPDDAFTITIAPGFLAPHDEYDGGGDPVSGGPADGAQMGAQGEDQEHQAGGETTVSP